MGVKLENSVRLFCAKDTIASTLKGTTDNDNHLQMDLHTYTLLLLLWLAGWCLLVTRLTNHPPPQGILDISEGEEEDNGRVANE